MPPSNTAKLSNWAAMIGITGAFILWCGALANMWYPHTSVSIYGFIVGAIILAFYWPMKYMDCLLFLISNIYMVGFSIYCFFSQPTTMAGITFITSAIVFAVAIYTGERNNTIGQKR